MERERNVKRVLVMIEYGENDPANGEVFDLTALASEIAGSKSNDHHHARIELSVKSSEDYKNYKVGEVKLSSAASWNVMANFHSSGEAAFLDDAVNASLPDSFATQDLRKKLTKLRKRTEKLEEDIKLQRLMDAASVRHQHPIARVTESAPQLAPAPA